VPADMAVAEKEACGSREPSDFPVSETLGNSSCSRKDAGQTRVGFPEMATPHPSGHYREADGDVAKRRSRSE
jgi:hypothetical protein